MRRILLAALLIMAGLMPLGRTATAQDAAQPVFIVTYAEVAPSAAADARKLFLGYVNDARKASGAVQIDAVQRISDPGHFALIEQWQSLAAKQAFAATEPVTKFRAALNPLQSAAYDERIHASLSVGSPKPASADAIVVLTHVDVVPTQVEPGTAKVKAFVEEGRNAPGNLRFDDVVQANRKNHFTVIEAWNSAADKNAWVSSKTARAFREELQPMSGALYDERVYKFVR
ncbi:MAG TPA: antibiotic biosynthesis monooxygenase [Bradyrhizobium sp.]|jgi:quinol monooxygenase YgiN|nr:antibiotic biosynthesis monooxygenase [Bradyrhizobium sp.]